jgi:light-regulated signal transduction histidine kinase (bacteriophytochrome)
MGVRASMSISLLRHGRLWGLIACHHYAGPHLPPYGARAAAEFLGSTLSLRLIDRFDDDQLRERLASQSMLAHVTAATLNESESVASALLGTPSLLDLLPSAGVVVSLGGEYHELGSVPPADVVAQVVTWARRAGEEMASTSRCPTLCPAWICTRPPARSH